MASNWRSVALRTWTLPFGATRCPTARVHNDTAYGEVRGAGPEEPDVLHRIPVTSLTDQTKEKLEGSISDATLRMHMAADDAGQLLANQLTRVREPIEGGVAAPTARMVACGHWPLATGHRPPGSGGSPAWRSILAPAGLSFARQPGDRTRRTIGSTTAAEDCTRRRPHPLSSSRSQSGGYRHRARAGLVPARCPGLAGPMSGADLKEDIRGALNASVRFWRRPSRGLDSSGLSTRVSRAAGGPAQGSGMERAFA